MSEADRTGRRIEVGGVALNVRDEGEGPPVLLLHGFPDSSLLWRHQIPVLVEAGMRVVAPDLRGYGESDAPEGVEAYALPTILEDVVGVLDELEIERVRVAGHDWGAAVAWGLAALRPERVERLAALSVGHPGTFPGDLEQRQRSWYMLLFQFEGVAEEALRHNDWHLFREAFAGGGDVDTYTADLSRPGRLTAALNWYRANISPESFVGAEATAVPAVGCPTLGVWGSGDVALTEEQMTRSAEWVTGPWRYERVEGAGHWIPVTAPQRTGELLLEFLGPDSEAPA